MAYRGNELLSIGQIAKRTGIAVSALRFYEESGLLKQLYWLWLPFFAALQALQPG